MADLADLQEKILYLLSRSEQSAVPTDVMQQDLRESSESVSQAIRALLESRRVTIHRGSNNGGGGPPRVYLSLASAEMSENFSLLYDAIRAAGSSGIDQQQLAARLRMPKADILKGLRALLQNQKIQEQRSFTNRAKKVYLLFHLQPSAQVTGGTLYCGEDLDVVLVDELRRRIVSYVSRAKVVRLSQIEAFIAEQTGGAPMGSMSASGGFPNSSSSSSPSAVGHYGLSGGEFAMVKAEPQHHLDEFSMPTSSSPAPHHSHGAGGREEDIEEPGSPIAFIHSTGGSANNSRLSFPPSTGPSATAATAAAASGGVGGGYPPSRASFPANNSPTPMVSIASKRIQPKDVRALVQTLVLDGVLDEIALASDYDQPVSSVSQSYLSFTLPSGGIASSGSSTNAFGESSTAGADTFLSSRVSAPAVAVGVGGGDPSFQLATGGNAMRHFTAAPLASSPDCERLRRARHQRFLQASAQSLQDKQQKQQGKGALSSAAAGGEAEAVGLKRARAAEDAATDAMRRGKTTAAHTEGNSGEDEAFDPEEGEENRGRARLAAARLRLAALYDTMLCESKLGPAEVARPSSSCSSFPLSFPDSMSSASPLSSYESTTPSMAIALAKARQAEAVRVGASVWAYMPAVGFPCLGCPQLASCSASGDGVVNQRKCAYLAEWLQ